MSDVIHWQDKFADTVVHCYRPGRRAEDVWMDRALVGESALVDSSDLVCVWIDWSR